MTPTVAVFQSRADAERGIDSLLKSGLSTERISRLTPNSSPEQIAQIRVSETEQPGMGAAVGSLVGGSVGAAGGFGAGAALASMLVPGVGPVLVGGLLGASLLGLTGATTGAAAGEAIEEKIPGIPSDELFVYKDALRQGRTIVIAEAQDEMHGRELQEILVKAGAETIDAAREKWWIGLRDTEKEAYSGRDFDESERYYRNGFEAAQSPEVGGRSFAEAQDYLSRRYEVASRHPSFRNGYERGRQYYKSLHEESTRSAR